MQLWLLRRTEADRKHGCSVSLKYIKWIRSNLQKIISIEARNDWTIDATSQLVAVLVSNRVATMWASRKLELLERQDLMRGDNYKGRI